MIEAVFDDDDGFNANILDFVMTNLDDIKTITAQFIVLIILKWFYLCSLASVVCCKEHLVDIKHQPLTNLVRPLYIC